MSSTFMGALPGSCEIVELAENHGSSESIKSRNQHLGRPWKKHTIEDDINKLFEAIDMESSCRGVGQGDRHFGDALNKSYMKRPMRAGPSGIRISEAVSLKQALRGLCISQASKMAAVRKQMARPSASPGISERGAIKKLHGPVVIEAGEAREPGNEGETNLVEVSLVPEKSSNLSDKSYECGQTSIAEVTERREQLFSSTNVVSKRLVAEHMDLDEMAPDPDEKLMVTTHVKQQNPNVLTRSSSGGFGHVERQNPGVLTRSSSGGFGLREQNFRTRMLKRTFVTKNQQNEEDKKGDDYQSSEPDFELKTGCDELEKVSSSTTQVSYGKQAHVLDISSEVKTAVLASDGGSREKGEISQSSKSSSIGEYSSSTTSHSEESYPSGLSRSGYRPHMSKDLRWEAIRHVQEQPGSLGLRHFKLLRKIGGGDIATVYLSELIGTNCLFAVKIMDNDSLISRNKMIRAQTEKEILEILDHPFLPTLYAHFSTGKYSCLVMEYCPGGDLHLLRQKQPAKCFPDKAARFYVAEVVLALEYLHMLGVVYRDLKPENILVREDGHIMLSDFDLSLRCSVKPMIVETPSPRSEPPKRMSSPCSVSSCIGPLCLQPSWQFSCFTTRFLSAAAKSHKFKSELTIQVIPLPQLVVEPTTARSNSFVGTHEYLAPEIIKGEGHGSAVDWWTLGIFLYELLYGKTPFKGSNNEETVSNVVSQCLNFPQYPIVSSHARDLIRRLLKKEPENRLGSWKGAAEIMRHPYFECLNWALIRCETPPEVPSPFDLGNVIPHTKFPSKTSKFPAESEHPGDDIEFEMF